MDLITLDFETYYDKDYSLRKMTTEEYIRDDRFEVIGVGVKVNNEPTEWASGTQEQLKKYLGTFNWGEAMLLAHNTMFDGAILSWRFDIHPRVLADTLCISRAVHGVEVSSSLGALAERYEIGVKGTEVADAMGKTRTEFTEEELDKYGDYCVNDVELTKELFHVMGKHFPKGELKLIDLTLRMFTEPVLGLDVDLLNQHLEDIKVSKDQLLLNAGVTKDVLMSNPKFSNLIESYGVSPPRKISPTTNKETFAFAKTDEGFIALAKHKDVKVRNAVEARLGLKSTLEETRTQRFIDIHGRGKLPAPIKYYAAHTGRWGGDDKINLQNLPSRGANGKKLKSSILAPEGCTLIDCDSSQIEARVLAWLAGQNNLTEAFKKGEDVYKKMASTIYDTAEDQISKPQRFVGKTTILGAGYGMGAPRFQEQLKQQGFDMSIDEARRVVGIYRHTNWKIVQFWRNCQNMLTHMANGDSVQISQSGVLEVLGEHSAIRLPSGLLMPYNGLKGVQGDKGIQYSYDTRRGRSNIYGGKVTENVCQAIARCIIGEQMLLIAKEYRTLFTVHDSVITSVNDSEVEEARKHIEECMRWTPDWCTDLPLNCESGIGKSYGDCE